MNEQQAFDNGLMDMFPEFTNVANCTPLSLGEKRKRLSRDNCSRLTAIRSTPQLDSSLRISWLASMIVTRTLLDFRTSEPTCQSPTDCW